MRSLGFLRAAGLSAVLVGALGSIGSMLHVGNANPSRIWFLLVVFAVWVLSPFVALVWADRVSTRWSVRTRLTLYIVMLVVTLCSLAVYGHVAFGPPRARPASVFLVVPPASWLLIAGAVWISDTQSRRRDAT